MRNSLRDFCDDHPMLSFLIPLIIASCLITWGLLAYYDQFYVTSEPMIISVTDKDHWTTTTTVIINKMPHVQIHHHYKICAEDMEISVDSTVYNSTNIGDRIIINRICRYKKSDNSLVKVYYEYAGVK